MELCLSLILEKNKAFIGSLWFSQQYPGGLLIPSDINNYSKKEKLRFFLLFYFFWATQPRKNHNTLQKILT